MTRSVNDSNKRSGQIVQSNQSLWMAHWMRTSCDSEAETRSENDNLTSGLSVARPVKAAIVSNTQLPNGNLTILDEDDCQSADLICERKMKSRSQADTSLLFDVPSTSRHQLQKLGQEWFQKIEKCSNSSSYEFYSPQKLPNCVHVLDTMRICTTINLSNENDFFSTPNLQRLLPFSGQYKRGVELQSLSSSSDSEGKRKRKIEDVKASKLTIGNESSTETHTMDMDSFKAKRLNSGKNSTPSTKAANIESNLSPLTGIPDINLEFPALPAAAEDSSHKTCPSSSRTQSLEMDILLAHAEQPKTKSNFGLNDPSDTWVKRLKRSSSNSYAQPTKSSNLSENPSHEKTSNVFQTIPQSKNITSSEPTPREHHGTKSIISGKSLDLSKERMKGNDLLLSHAWIKRLQSKGSRINEMKPEIIVVCEPQSLKLGLEDLHKKQFPSIAAMVMMGKTMNGFQSCEIEKKGSYTVWNTKAF